MNCDDCSVVDSIAFQQCCHLCVRDEINEQINDFTESKLLEEEKSAKKNKLHARLSSWTPKGRRVSGVAVLGKGGGVSGDPFGDIRGHWEKVFNNGGGRMLLLRPLASSSRSVLATLGLSLGMSSTRFAMLTGGPLLALMVSRIGLGRPVVGKLMVSFTIVA